MLIQAPSTNSYLRSPILLLIILVVSLNGSACKCKNSGKSASYKELTLEVSPTSLVEDQTILVATFKLAKGHSTANLTQYKVRLKFTETGGVGSSLTYLDGTNATHSITTLLEENIAHFATTDGLNAPDPVKVIFTIVPGKDVQSIDINFELINQKDEVLQTYTANWKKSNTSSSVKLTLASNSSELRGNDPLTLKITNNGDKPLETGKLKLKIKRPTGNSATIVGASATAAGYELKWLEQIPVNTQGITKTLTINPSTDRQATFIFQVMYNEGAEEKAMGEAVTVHWQVGVQLSLKDITYDKNTGNILYTIANEGAEPIQEIKLHYHTKTNGVKVNGMMVNQPQTVDVGNLAPSEGKENINIGSLDLGENSQAEFEFWLSYAGATTAVAKQSKTFTVTKAIDLFLTSSNGIHLKGKDNLHLVIKNKGLQPSKAGKLKLKIIRITGSSAIIGDTSKKGSGYELDLPEIIPIDDQGITKTLTIDPGTDNQAAFTFQLIYEDGSGAKPVGEAIAVDWDWELGTNLVLKNIQYDATTGHITYTLANEGTQVAKDVKLHYESNNKGATIDNKLFTTTQVVSIGDLATGEQQVNKKLGQLSFGGDKNAAFNFWVSYERGPNTGAKQAVVFVAADVQLQIAKLVYDPVTYAVTYAIQNDGKALASNVQLRYTNVSVDVASKKVLLDNKDTNTLHLVDIPKESSTSDQVLKIDFKSATEARFKFEVLYQGRVVATQELDVKTPTVKLKLVPGGPTSLVGKETAVIWRIEQEIDSGPLDFDKLSVEISPAPTSPATILYNGSTVTKIPGIELQIGKDISLIIEPGTALEISYKLQLLYGGKSMGNTLTFMWEVDPKEATKRLFEAISSNNLEEAKQLLNKKATIRANAATYDSWTPLHEALANENIIVTNLLLDKKADVNAMDQLNGTPLHMAVAGKDNDKLIEVLLNRGANINLARDSDGSTPLHIAVNQENQEYVTLLLAKGAQVNATDRGGNTPLHKAAEKVSQGIIEQLLAVADIQVNSKNAQDETPLHKAALNGNRTAIELLLNKGAQVDAITKEGETPLHKAALNGNRAAIELLLNKGAQVDAITKEGETPLHKAALKGNEAATTALLARGAALNAINKAGNTPLHHAVGSAAVLKIRQATVGKLLNTPGIDIDANNAQGNTPLHLAVMINKNDKVIQLLLDKGARKDIKNNLGETPADLAKKSTNAKIKRLLGITVF